MFKVENNKPRGKWYSLYDKVFSEKKLEQAFLKVKQNKGTGGIDRVALEQYRNKLAVHARELSRLLKQKTYQPFPVRRVLIPKANGKTRPLGIPAIRDRVVQQSLKETLEPIFEPEFHQASFGFRLHKSPHQAIQQIEEYLQQGYQWVVDADIEDFFGNLNHELLLDEVNTKVADSSILRLIRSFLEAGAMIEGQVVHQTTGTPQGGVISPLLSNIYLNSFDWQIAEQGYKLVRYCDDWIILAKTQQEAQAALELAQNLLQQKGLTLNTEKTRAVHHQESFEFLGFWFKDYDGRYRKGPRKRAAKAYQDKIRYATRRQQPKNIKMLAERLNPITRGWGRYFCVGDMKSLSRRLDGWTRMRLRSFILKQHRVSLQAHMKYQNQYFRDLGFCFLEDLTQIAFPAMGQRYRKAACGKSARTV